MLSRERLEMLNEVEVARGPNFEIDVDPLLHAVGKGGLHNGLDGASPEPSARHRMGPE